MIVTKLTDILNTDRDISGPGWSSRRLLLAQDGTGFTMTDTLIKAGASLKLEYKHHVEACYCINGQGDVTAHADGITHPIEPYTLYALDKNDRHTVRALGGDLRLVCVFNPALSGQEVHRADGSYAPEE